MNMFEKHHCTVLKESEEIPVCKQAVDEDSSQLNSEVCQADDVISKPAVICAHGPSDPVGFDHVCSEVADSNPDVLESVNQESVSSSPLKSEIVTCQDEKAKLSKKEGCVETAPDNMTNGASPKSKDLGCTDQLVDVDETGVKKQIEQMSLGPKEEPAAGAIKKTCSPS